MQILREELAKHGIQLKAGGTLEGVCIPARTSNYELLDKGNGQREFKETVVEVPDRAKPLKLSGIDSDRRIAVEFVSHQDYFDLGGVSNGSTVQIYQFKNITEYVAEHAKKQGKDGVFFGVFYDPSPKMPRADLTSPVDWKAQREQGKQESKKLLRQQAQDFVAWLKEQKAIQ
ncbi:MAG: hypothetical protein ABSG53_10185 [Thermoguttaceae bacterium]|jgi:hypothetical protein